MVFSTKRNESTADMKTPMRAPWGDIAPRLTEISNTILFDDVWRRPGLSPRDRSLITVASLIALYRSNELKFHLGKALENGVTRDEIIEVITHLASYSGWPTASTAIGIVREVFAATQEPTQSKGASHANA
jgi:4-carboxymuconolactone decarboxylase